MKPLSLAAATFAILLVAVLAGNYRGVEGRVEAPALMAVEGTSPPAPVEHGGEGFLFGRVTTEEGTTYAGRLRFGRTEEAFWGDYFNGFKHKNPWAGQSQVPGLTQKRRSFTIFGFEIPLGTQQIDLGRPFMARFGDIARMEEQGRDLRVTLKSGTVFELAWGAANDFDDGVRVWDEKGGAVDLASWAGGIPPPSRVRIRTIELLAPPAPLRDVPPRLHGTVRTRHGDFSGFIQWNRQSGVSTDVLIGRTVEGPVRLRFDTIRAIARRTGDSAQVTLTEGRELVLSVTRTEGEQNGGMYVDDRRYGRVLVSWGAVERVDFSAAGDSGPAYNDFPKGRPLTGTVTTRGGQRLTGRLVYDLDESETTETLDAPAEGVDYTIPFGMVATVAAAGGVPDAPRVSVTLHSGEVLQLERAGDLGAGNAGVLVFVEGRERPEYVRWTEIARIDFERPNLPSPESLRTTAGKLPAMALALRR
jgi:hypothetical protein